MDIDNFKLKVQRYLDDADDLNIETFGLIGVSKTQAAAILADFVQYVENTEEMA